MLACVLLAGCGGSNVVPVSGTLTYKGKPVTNAYITSCRRTAGRAWGRPTRTAGSRSTYDPQTKGAERGKHRVFVQYNAVADAGQPGVVPGEAPKLSNEWREFFNKYGGDNSKVEVVIDKSTSDLKLEWD